jgi:hypothetical protein
MFPAEDEIRSREKGQANRHHKNLGLYPPGEVSAERGMGIGPASLDRHAKMSEGGAS